jgi:hypothetical protein
MKFLAFLRPGSKKSVNSSDNGLALKDINTGYPNVDRWWGQGRHVVDKVATVFFMFGLQETIGVDVTPDSWSVFIGLSEQFINAAAVAIGLLLQAIAHSSSWFSKDN